MFGTPRWNISGCRLRPPSQPLMRSRFPIKAVWFDSCFRYKLCLKYGVFPFQHIGANVVFPNVLWRPLDSAALIKKASFHMLSVCWSHPPWPPLWLAHRWGPHLLFAPHLAPPLFPQRQQPSAGCPQSLWKSPGLFCLCTGLSRKTQTHIYNNEYLAADTIIVEATWIFSSHHEPLSYEYIFDLDLTQEGWAYLGRTL